MPFALSVQVVQVVQVAQVAQVVQVVQVRIIRSGHVCCLTCVRWLGQVGACEWRRGVWRRLSFSLVGVGDLVSCLSWSYSA
jgi:hypothetical protein